MTRLLALAASLAAGALAAACGGDGEADACVPPQAYRAWIASGVLAARPPMQAGDVWAAPWLLSPVRVAPPAADLYLPRGPYYVAGERPGYLCND